MHQIAIWITEEQKYPVANALRALGHYMDFYGYNHWEYHSHRDFITCAPNYPDKKYTFEIYDVRDKTPQEVAKGYECKWTSRQDAYVDRFNRVSPYFPWLNFEHSYSTLYGHSWKITFPYSTTGVAYNMSDSSFLIEKQSELLEKALAYRHAYELHTLYPNIFFSTMGYKDTWHLYLTHRHDTNNSGTSIGSVPKDELDYWMLSKLNALAAIARQPGWFWCTRCGMPKPASAYGHYWFNSVRCKQCLADDPAWARSAANETYN